MWLDRQRCANKYAERANWRDGLGTGMLAGAGQVAERQRCMEQLQLEDVRGTALG